MDISPELARFILTSVPSIPFLEAALLLRRDPAVSWTGQDIARALYVGTTRADHLLLELERAGVAASDRMDRRCWRLAPLEPAVARAYDELAELYRLEVIAVTRLIHDATQRSAHRFADAFKLRKDP